MSAQLNFVDRLRAVVVPTLAQALSAIVISLVILVLVQSQTLLRTFGITGPILVASQHQFQARLDALLTTPFISQLSLITFWAAIGLLAYLVCWGAYNVWVEARNEVTLTTAYTNRGRHWRGPRETLALKAVAGLGLALIIGSLRLGLPFWLAISGQALNHLSLFSIFGVTLAVLGLAFQLYLILVFVQLTFTPWYRIQTFTDV